MLNIRFYTLFLIVFFQSILVFSIEPKELDFKYKIFHKSETFTDFYIKIDLSTYLPKLINNSKYVKIGILVSLTNAETNKNYKSSREFNLDIADHKNGIYLDSFSIHMEPANYLMDIVITDLNMNKSKEEYREFSKNSMCIPENFLFMNSDSSLIYYHENPKTDKINFHSEILNCDSLEIRMYNSIQTIALPPFSSSSAFPDYGAFESISFKSCSLKEFSISGIQNKTLFITTASSKNEEGFLFSQFANYYPEVKTVDLLVEPLRYISSREEYTVLADKGNQRRKKFEEFWLDKAKGDREQARYLIKTYYSRVEYANTHFSTYKEGWKTDRGMVLLVFGEPERIENEGRQEESWIYTGRSGTSSISFSFYRQDGPFLENDYALVRNVIFKSQWYDAVDSWRNGMPYKK